MNVLYTHTEDVHNMNAPRAVVPILMQLTNPQSVLDVGCGTGTWLKAFEEVGITDYLGVDGDYVNRSMLQISPNKFVTKDLRNAWTVNQKFDLVLSLEVAEHLPETSADFFVETLVAHASSTIIFSAAIPGQGGQNHLNEQWPEYWQQKFSKHGFYFNDVIRPVIWDNDNVEWWYRQNIFLVDKNQGAKSNTLSLVHPRQFEQMLRTEKTFNDSLLRGEQGIRVSTAIFFNALKLKFKNLF